MLQLLQGIIAIAKIVNLLLRWLETKRKDNAAREAVAADLQRLAREFQARADTARAAVDHSPDGVLNDIQNRDVQQIPSEPSEDGKTDSLPKL